MELKELLLLPAAVAAVNSSRHAMSNWNQN